MRAIITGASSGIGLALARELAKRGWDLALLARRGDLLESVAEPLRARGRRVAVAACDVADAKAVREAVRQTEAELGGAFDLAIANAGISVPMHAAKFSASEAEHLLRVNIFGVIYLYDAVIPGMIERGSGRFAGIASIAGLRGLPTAGPYSASKAAVQAFLESARVELAELGVGVTIVNPGWVATPLVEKNRFRMPFLMQAGDAAIIIADGLERGARLIEFPRPMSILMRVVRLLPDALYDRIMKPYARRKVDRERARR
jgi:short-subunit dehydrogenase